MREFLVYRYVDMEHQKVIYIGMGKGNRPYRHWKGRAANPMFGNVLAKMKSEARTPLIEIVQDGLTREQAAVREEALIRFYGRRCDGSGPLCNISSGGIDSLGDVSLTPDQMAARAISVRAALKRPEVEERRLENLRASRRTDESRRRTSIITRARSVETLAKIGAATKARMADGEFREKVMAANQSPEAQAKRRASLQAFHQTERGRQVREMGRIASAAKRAMNSSQSTLLIQGA